jgi:RNA polymerase sigma-70 factor (ECF subfamily)
MQRHFYRRRRTMDQVAGRIADSGVYPALPALREGGIVVAGREVAPEMQAVDVFLESSDGDAAPDCDESDASAPVGDLGELYSRYIGPIYRFLYSRVGNREDAEDLASETFLKAFRYLDASRSEASTAHWLFLVARTVAADHWRKYYRHGAFIPIEDLNLEAARDPSMPLHVQTAEVQVMAALACLPESYRRVLEFRFLHGYSILETAEAMGVTPGNAKVLQHRALAKAARLDFHAEVCHAASACN